MIPNQYLSQHIRKCRCTPNLIIYLERSTKYSGHYFEVGVYYKQLWRWMTSPANLVFSINNALKYMHTYIKSKDIQDIKVLQSAYSEGGVLKTLLLGRI